MQADFIPNQIVATSFPRFCLELYVSQQFGRKDANKKAFTRIAD
jgi:hypothetical protein